MECKDSLNNHDINRLYALNSFRLTAMQRKVIDRYIHTVPVAKGFEVVAKELCLKGIRMIVVPRSPLLGREVGLITIVGV
jgi:hypothetical protein